MDIDALLGPFERLLDDNIASPMTALETSGFLDVMKSEEDGGAGLSLLEAEPLFHAIGARGLSADLAIAIAARGAITVSNELSALIHAMLIAGGIDRLLTMSVDYANTRVQFGKPIGRQQALQQQLAQLAEQAALVRVAAQYGAASGMMPSPERAAVAKYAASAAVPLTTSIAHAVHGAIGITQEFDLQRIVRPLHEWRMAAGSESYWARILGQSRVAVPNAPSVDFVRSIV